MHIHVYVSVKQSSGPLNTCTYSHSCTYDIHLCNAQSTQQWDTIIPQPSHQTKDIYTSSTLFIAPATTETHHQDTFRRSRFLLHCTYCLELSEQLHCRYSPCLSRDSRHSYSAGLLIRFSSQNCSCPIAPRKSFDILVLYKSDYYYYYYYY